MTVWFGRIVAGVIVCGGALLMCSTVVFANSLASPNYRFDESTLGAGGQIESSSTNFRSANSAGDLGVGESASGNYQINAGSQTSPDPTLSFVINTASPNLGSFSSTAASTGTATFSVSNYTSYGYAVQIVGNSPSNGAKVLPAMSSTSPSQTGVEQFGINLVANTDPQTWGANPDKGQFGFGEAAPNYGVANQFRFVSGETIALAPKSSGKTIYTMSYLVNVAPLTPGGQYKANQTLIVTGTY